MMENQIDPSHHQTQPAAIVPNDALPPLSAPRRRRRANAKSQGETIGEKVEEVLKELEIRSVSGLLCICNMNCFIQIRNTISNSDYKHNTKYVKHE